MIVDPDFPGHWKTRLLVTLLGNDAAAPVYVLRLWGHCQIRRQWKFEGMPPAGLAAVCGFEGDPEDFERAMVAARFVKRDGDVLIAWNWDQYNAALIASWRNGKRGGRPKKEPAKPETAGYPTGNPRVSECGNPRVSENPAKTQSKPAAQNPQENGASASDANSCCKSLSEKGVTEEPTGFQKPSPSSLLFSPPILSCSDKSSSENETKSTDAENPRVTAGDSGNGSAQRVRRVAAKFDRPEVRQALQLFAEYHRDVHGKTWTEQQSESTLMRWMHWEPEKLIAAIHFSISVGAKSIRDPDEDKARQRNSGQAGGRGGLVAVRSEDVIADALKGRGK